MSETTLRVKTQADIAALRGFREELRATRAEVEAFQTASGGGGGGGGGEGGGSPTSAGNPPTPSPTGPSGGGAPTPSPTAPPPGAGPGAGGGAGGGGSSSGGGAAAIIAGLVGYLAGRRGGGGDDEEQGPSTWAKVRKKSTQYLKAMGSQAVQLGLGDSIEGFILNSGQKFLELSKIITHVGARFREERENVIGFGSAMGYTLGESAGLVETLGEVRNSVNRTEFLRYAGFGRTMGMDPSRALGGLGQLAQLTGGQTLTDRQLAELSGRASGANMGMGRLPEFMSLIERIAGEQFQATGEQDWRRVMTAQGLPGQVFGAADPRAKGDMGMSLTQGLNQTLTGNPAMQTFMMRAMGYGGEGGPGYIEMRKRLEAGVHDPRNVMDLFKAFRARGMGKGAMYRALESVSGGSLQAWQIEGLVDSLGSDAGLNAYGMDAVGWNEDSDVATGGGGAVGQFTSSGRRRISMGEGRALQLEGMQMSIGDTVATVMVDMTDTIKSLVNVLKNFSTWDVEGFIKGVSGDIKHMADSLDKITRPGTTFRQGLDNTTSDWGASAMDFMGASRPWGVKPHFFPADAGGGHP